MAKTACLLDLRTGSICFDKDGNLLRVNNNYGFRQVIHNLFHTVRGGEILAPSWGFDLVNAIRRSHLPGVEMYIKSLVAEALDDEIEPLIAEINYIYVNKPSSTDKRMNVEISVRSIFNNSSILKVGLEE